MAHVPLHPIGSPRSEFCDDSTFAARREALAVREAKLLERRAVAHAGWGPSYIERVHRRGKLTARERVDRLADPGSRTFEVGTFVNDGLTFGEQKLTSPAAGVITAFVRVVGRLCMVIANDNTVASGSWWPMSCEKIERAQQMALRLRIPAIYLVDCSGLFLPEQSRSFPGARGAGHIFKMNSLLSDHGVPQLAGVFGDCIAGGGYMPIISDRVYMTEQAYMVIAGAALVKGAKGQTITSLDIGGPEVHVHQSRCADVRVPDDPTLLDALRTEVARLPSSAAAYYRADTAPLEPRFPSLELGGLLPSDHREAYDVTEVLARLCDQSLFWESMAAIGREVVCGVGRMGGLFVGFVANRQGLMSDPDRPSGQRPTSIFYREGIAKVAAFSRACNDDGIPMVWLQDIAGFDIGPQAEQKGLLGYGSSLIYTNSTNTVPMFTVLLRKASGAGYYAMAGLPYDPVVQLSTMLSRLSVMEGRTLAIATYNTKLDHEFRIMTDDPEERRVIEAGMRDVETRIERDMDPLVAARQMDTDEIVELHDLRDYLAMLVEASYQSIAYRRVKNPRIWSLHDLDVLTERTRESVALTPWVAQSAPEGREAQSAPEGREAQSAPEGREAQSAPEGREAQSAPEERLQLRSPTVGVWRGAPFPGTIIGSGSHLGQIETLGGWRDIVAPEGVLGIVVADSDAQPTVRPIEFGSVLVTLDRVGEGNLPTVTDRVAAGTSDTASSGLLFRTPLSGRYYSRPSPAEPSFVEPGQIVARGQTIALLEVMKTFNRIIYGGAAWPERARVVRMCCENEVDVEAGDPLLVLEPET